MKHTYTLTLLLWLLMPTFLIAQRVPLALTTLETPHFKARISNSADHFWDFVNRAGLEVPAGSGRNTQFAHSMWIGGMDPSGQLHMAGQTYRQTGLDFFTGPVLPNPADATGKGFDKLPALSLSQLIGSKTGKFVYVQENGVQLYDASTNQVSPYFFLQRIPFPNSIELADSSILVVGMNYGDPTVPCYRFHPDHPNLGTYFVDSTQRGFPYMHLLPDGRVLLISPISQEVFDPQTNQIQPFPIAGLQLKGPMYRFNQDTLLTFTGGISLNGTGQVAASAATQLIDVSSQTAVPGPSLLFPRIRPLVLTAASGEMYVLGGTRQKDTVERFNPVTRQFEYAGQLGGADLDLGGVVLPDGSMLLSMDYSYYYYSPILVRFTPQTQSAQVVTIMPRGRLLAITPNAQVAFSSDPNRISVLDLDYRTIQDEPYQYVWQVSAAEIAQFQQDYALGQVDFRNYPDIATWPGNGRTALGEPAQLAPYVDVNLDGQYRPSIDGDYPCIRGDVATWSVYNDLGPHGETGGVPLGIEVESMAWAVDCNLRPCPDPDMQYVVFQHLEITNRSALDYHDLYVGGYHDFDLGNAFDDHIGCDTMLGLAFGYNGDDNDDGAQGYGIAPPATGSIILPNAFTSGMQHFQYYENDFSLRGNPINALEHYGYMQSIWRDGSHVVDDGGDGYGSGGTPINFMYPGDAGFCGGGPQGWNEVSAGSFPFDRRYVQSTGPLQLQAGATLEYDYAVLYGRGTDHLNSVCELKANAAALQAWWPSLQATCGSIPLATRDPQAPVIGLNLAPNPASTHAELRLDAPLRARTELRVCDLAGRVQMQESLGAGTQVHDLDVQALPAGMYLVQFQSAAGYAVQRIAVQR